MSLYDELLKNEKNGSVPMHMPGHKRQVSFAGELPYGLDITEIDGFDNLHHREGILKELSLRMANLRNSAYAIPLVGGSTVGILACVKAMTNRDDGVIMARGCHKSVYHAAELFGLKTEYIYPESDDKNGFFLSVTAEDINKAFKKMPEAKLVIITSPTYEGVISDIGSIADIVHQKGAKLLVDAAHGAHLGYNDKFPSDALSKGADAVVESLHKTLPAMTQTAALYINKDINPVPFEKALGMLETSSPSYVLMASIDRCISILESDKERLFDDYYNLLSDFKQKISGLKNLCVRGYNDNINCFGLDSGKIIISTHKTDKNGLYLAKALREKYHIEPEMVSENYVLCMTSICDNDSTMSALANALIEIDSELKLSDERNIKSAFIFATPKMTLDEASMCDGEYIPLNQSVDRISLSYLWAYPPGIPVVAPGEMITEEILSRLDYMKNTGVEIQQEGEENSSYIFVLSDAENN